MMKTFIFLLMLCFPLAAYGHVQPQRCEPKVGATIKQPPKELKIWFDGPVGVARSHIEAIDKDNQSILRGDLHGDDDDNTVLIIPLRRSYGKMTVKWDAYCPDCDHTSHGTFTFTVAP